MLDLALITLTTLLSLCLLATILACGLMIHDEITEQRYIQGEQ